MNEKKILHVENKKGGKLILIPCYMYDIVITQTFGGDNALESMITKIIDLDSRYKDENELIKLLGIKDKEILKEKDFKELLKTILSKISNDNKEVRTEVKMYQIYQERYSGKVLGYISYDLDKFKLSNDEGFKADKIMEIKFDDKKALFYAKINKDIKKQTPTNEQIFNAVNTHNKYADSKISTKNMEFNIKGNGEEIYLCTQIVLGENIDFNITNGFNAAYSPLLNKIVKENCDDLLKYLREKEYTQGDKDSTNYKQKYGDLRDDVIYYLNAFDNKKEYKASNLYNAFEKYFEYIVKQNKYNIQNSLNTESNLIKLAKKIGFKIPKSTQLFKNDKRDNLKTYFAKLLINENQILTNIAKQDSNFLYILNDLHIQRNKELHGDKKAKKTMDIKEINILLDILLNETKNFHLDEMTKITDYSHNGVILLQKDLDKNMRDRLGEQNISDLAKVYLACENLESLSIEIFSDIVDNLYKVCESLLKEYCTDKSISSDMQEIKSLQQREHLGDALKNVSEQYINSALKYQGASLGAYMLIYMTKQKADSKYIKSIDRVIQLRGHGNHTINDLQKTNIQELESIKTNAIDFIKEIISQLT